MTQRHINPLLACATLLCGGGVAFGACDDPVGAVGSTAPGGFTTSEGQIIGPDGKPWIAKGINLFQSQTGDLPEILNELPGINFIRLNVFDLNTPPAAFQGFVQQAAAAGVVVEFEDHTNNGGNGNAGGMHGTIFQGAQLQQELAFYHNMAGYYAGSPNVFFGTNNEPSDQLVPGGPDDPAALSVWQGQTYDAIRSAGNNNPILLEINGLKDPTAFGAGYDVNSIAQMKNVIADVHQYGWVTDYSTDQNRVTQGLMETIATVHHFTTASGPIPVLIGEFGPSTTGAPNGLPDGDPNGQEVVNSVLDAGISSAAWGWRTGAADNISDGNGGLTPFGQQIAAYFKTTVCPGQVAFQPIGNVPHVLPQTALPVAPPLPANLLAPAFDLPGSSIPTTTLPDGRVQPVAPDADIPLPPDPELPVPPVPDVSVAPEPPAQKPPPVEIATPINTTYPQPIPRPVLPVVVPEIDPIAVIINTPDPPVGANPIGAGLVGEMKQLTKDYGMISPIGTWLMKMDTSMVAGGDAALSGQPAMLTIPVTVAALLFMGARGARMLEDGGSLSGLWFDLFKIMIIIKLSLNIGDYDFYVRDFIFTSIPNSFNTAIAAGLTGVATGVQGVASTMDAAYAEAWKWVARAWQDAGIMGFGTQIAAWICGITISASLVAMTLVYLLARLLLMVVLSLGPPCIACSMHKQTAPIFERWMGKCIALVFLQVSGILVLVMVLTANKFFMDQLAPMLNPPGTGNPFPTVWGGVDPSPVPTGANDIQALSSMVVWFGMGAFALYSLPAIAYSIGTGVATSFMPVALALAASASSIGGAIAGALGAIPALSFGGGGGGGLSMSLARDDLDGGSSFSELPPPPPPPLSGATPPRLA